MFPLAVFRARTVAVHGRMIHAAIAVYARSAGVDLIAHAAGGSHGAAG